MGKSPMTYQNRSRDFFQIPAGRITFLIAATTVVLIFAWGYIVYTRGKRLGCSDQNVPSITRMAAGAALKDGSWPPEELFFFVPI